MLAFTGEKSNREKWECCGYVLLSVDFLGVTANRIGHESRGGKPVLKFIGKSEVVSPKGEILRRASTDEEDVGIVEVDVNDARQKSINPYNDLLRDRQPQHYSR